jgi:hypothetical protein
MSADGNWNLLLKTPMGDRKATLSLTSSGDTLTGKQGGDQGSTDIFEGKVAGNDVSWKISIQQPFALTLTFKGKVDGDKIAGSADTGMMGSFPFEGSRA